MRFYTAYWKLLGLTLAFVPCMYLLLAVADKQIANIGTIVFGLFVYGELMLLLLVARIMELMDYRRHEAVWHVVNAGLFITMILAFGGIALIFTSTENERMVFTAVIVSMLLTSAAARFENERYWKRAGDAIGRRT